MTIGFVVPGPTAADRLTPAVDHALAALIAELRRRGVPVVRHELEERHWLLPPSAFAESALFLADRLSGCDLVVDLTAAWAPLVRRSGRRLNAVPLLDAGVAPWTDVTAFGLGDGTGRYVLLPDLPERGLRDGLGPVVAPAPRHERVVMPGDAGPDERGALLADAVAYVAGDGPWAGFDAAEALAVGTPVIARSGSPAAELVDHGTTGIIVEVGAGHPLDPATLDAAAARAAGLSRWAARKTAHDHHSTERAALDLLVLAGRPPAGARPVPVAAGMARPPRRPRQLTGAAA